MPYTTLISCSELADYVGNSDWVIIDCRFDLADTAWGQDQYAEAHIPGARYAHLDSDLSSPVIPGTTGRHPLPSVEVLARTLSKWGIDELTQVVAYDQNGGMFASRLWWMLRWLGHEKVTVLDGGWQRWTEEGLPSDGENPLPEAGSFAPHLSARLEASTEDVVACLNDPAVQLLDARGADRFRGENETLDPVAGHIPGAISAPFMDNLGPDGCFLEKDRLKQYYTALLGKTAASDAIVYCGSGVTAAHNVLAMVHAGLDEPRLYAGSWSHWITDQGRPVTV